MLVKGVLGLRRLYIGMVTIGVSYVMLVDKDELRLNRTTMNYNKVLTM